MVVLASNLGWRNVPLKERLEHELDGLRVEVDKDTNAAALAEARLGAGREYRHFLYVTAGTGIGGGLILGGALYRGATGGAGDIGHVVVDPDGPPCGCGGYGHVEVFSSGAGMVNRAREMLADGARSEEHTSELQSRQYLVCRLLLEKKKYMTSCAPAQRSIFPPSTLPSFTTRQVPAANIRTSRPPLTTTVSLQHTLASGFLPSFHRF